MCELHTDAAYIAARRMAPHLYATHTLCFGGFYAQRSNDQAMYLRSQQLQHAVLHTLTSESEVR